MLPVLRLNLRPALCCCLLVAALPASFSVMAMSLWSDDAPTKLVSFADANVSKLAEPYVGTIPEADARAALDNGDTRLLGFALRSANVPGVKPKDVKAATDACGIRFMKGFGDVVRSSEHVAAMRLAHDYAVSYNTVVVKRCLKK